MWRNLLIYGGLTFLVLLAGAVLGTIFSLLHLAQKREDNLERYETLAQALVANQDLVDASIYRPAVSGGAMVPGGIMRLEKTQGTPRGDLEKRWSPDFT